MKTEELLKDYKDAFNFYLQGFFETDLSYLIYRNKNKSLELFEAIEYSVSNGGKRLRPILSLITAEAIKNSPERLPIDLNPSSDLAIAIELLHCGSLIHDDLPCLDNDELRRGQATTHIKFGEDIALLAGDFLLNYPLEVLLNSDKEAGLKSQAALELSRSISSMILGQSMDMNLMRKKDQNIYEVSLMQELKTGALIESSVSISALLAGANSHQIESLSGFSKKIGLAFQIIDDVLDYSSDPEILGKSVGKDFVQNKHSFVKEYGVIGSQDIAQTIIKEAKSIIDSIDIYPDKLKLIADYVISRIN
jgi:geranylgeranyl diphosphate synthase, type II